MRPIDGTITDRKMDKYWVNVGGESLHVEALDQYQDLAGETAMYPRVYTEHQVVAMLEMAHKKSPEELLDYFETPFNRLVYPILGLVGEAGEIANKAKKIARDKQGQMDTEAVEDSEKELGDVFWYVAAVSRELGLKLSNVATKNVGKLFSRKERGVLGGSGDNR